MSEPVSSHDHGNCALCDQLERELAEARDDMERRDREGAESLAMAGGCVEDLQTKLAAAEEQMKYPDDPARSVAAMLSRMSPEDRKAFNFCVKAAAAAAEQRERALRDELAHRGFHATERAPCPQCLDALALTPPGPSVER